MLLNVLALILLLLAPVADPPAPDALLATAPDAGLDAAEQALQLAHHGQPLAAWEALLDDLLASIAQADWSEPLAGPRAEVEALLLTALTDQLDRWPEVVNWLPTLSPWPAATPPELAFLMDHLLADALRRVGKADRARGLVSDMGYVTDWYLIGPFDNERGGGFDVAYGPESEFDRTQSQPGKERDVSWRVNPGRQHPLGRLRLDQLLRPARQSVAYLATTLTPLAPGPIDLALGSSGSFKVFLDGNLLASRKLERPIHPDQDRVRLDLREGPNQLLIKLAVEDGAWEFEARLTHLDGTPALDVQSRSAFCAWPGPSPDADAIAWWDLEPDPWSVEKLAGGTPTDDWGDAEDVDAPAGADAAGVPPGSTEPAAPAGPDAAGAPAGPEDGTTPGQQQAPEVGADSGSPPWVWPVPRTRASAEPSRGRAIDWLTDRTEDAEAARLATVWQLLVHPDDRVQRSALPLARRAVALDPHDVVGLYLLSRAEEVGGQSRNEREVNQQLADLRAVLAEDAGHVSALLDLASFHLDENPLPDLADQLLTRALAVAPESWRVLTLRADQLQGRRRGAEAEQLRRRAEATPEARSRQAGLLARAHRVLAMGQPARALDLLWKAWERDMLGRSVTDELVSRLIDGGQIDKALYVVEKSLQADPFDLRRMLVTARRLLFELGAGPARGHELVARALDACPEDTGALDQMVSFELAHDSESGARLVLSEILRLDPGNEQARRRLALLSSEQQEHFEQPWRRDASRWLGTPLPESGNDPLEVLERSVVFSVHPDGTQHRYEHLVLRVLNQGGVRSLDDWTFSTGAGASLRVFNVRVLHPDGRVENAPVPRRGGGSWRRYDLPPLTPGDMVDLEWRRDQFQAGVFGEYFGTRYEFYADRPDPLAPTRRSELVVLAPPGVPLYVASRNAEGLDYEEGTDQAGRRVLHWVAHDLRRPPVQTAMPGRDELAPVVDVTTFRDWNAFANWWWHFIEKEFVTTDAMRAKVAELTAGLSTERQKIEAVARFVGQEIRYNAWAFGTHGYEPYSAATIFERRFGDCKDKSILMRQLLAEVGVEAVPVLLRAQWRRSEEPLDAAMIGHFNHCITWLPPTDTRPGMYLDATADLDPIDYLRADDQGAHVLHVDAQGGQIHMIPYSPPGQNQLRRRYDVQLSDNGDAQVALSDESNGQFGVRLRALYGGQQGDLEQTLARDLGSVFGSVQVESVETSELEDIGQPARLAATLEVSSLWTPEGGLRTLPVSLDELGLESVAIEPPEERRFDLVLDRPFSHETEIVYRLPPGCVPRELPEPVFIDEPGLLRYLLSVRDEAGAVHVKRSFELSTHRVSLDDYARFRAALRQVEQAERRSLRVQPPIPD